MTPEILAGLGNLEGEIPRRHEAMAMEAAYEYVAKNEATTSLVEDYCRNLDLSLGFAELAHTRTDDACLRLGFASIAYVRATGSSYHESKTNFADKAGEFWNAAYCRINSKRGKLQLPQVFTNPSARQNWFGSVMDQTCYYLRVEEDSPRWPLLVVLKWAYLETETQPWD